MGYETSPEWAHLAIIVDSIYGGDREAVAAAAVVGGQRAALDRERECFVSFGRPDSARDLFASRFLRYPLV